MDDEEKFSAEDEARTANERAVLGAAIQSARAAQEIALILRPEMFGKGAHQTVFEAVTRLADDGEPVDPAAVLTELARTGRLGKVAGSGAGSGGAFLHSLMTSATTNALWHAVKVREAWHRDNLASSLRTGLGIVGQPGYDPAVHPDAIRKLVEDATALPGGTALRTSAEILEEVLTRLEEGTEPGLPTGLADLDEATGGLKPGTLTIIAARPGVGKSVLAMQSAEHVAGHLGLPALFASLEMSAEQLFHRRIAATAKVPLHFLTRPPVPESGWEHIRRAYAKLSASELRVDDTPNVGLAHIRGQLRAMTRAGSPARLLVVDYLGLLAEPARAENRQAAVAANARGLRNIGREFGIPVIAAAQLNRGPEHRSDRRPVLADLRESGEIEAAADVVILLHREDAYERESPRAGEIDLIVQKNRQGPQCTITACFQGHYSRILDMAPSWDASSKHAKDAA